jgi:hypothetical protein
VSSFQCRRVKFTPTVTAELLLLIITTTLVGLPWIYDAVVVAVEEGGVLLHHAHVVVPVVVVRRAVRVVDVRCRQSSRQVCTVRRQIFILSISHKHSSTILSKTLVRTKYACCGSRTRLGHVLFEVPADGARDGHRRLQRHDGLRVLGLHAVQRLVAAFVVVAFQHVFTDLVPLCRHPRRAGVTVPRLRRRCHARSAAACGLLPG